MATYNNTLFIFIVFTISLSCVDSIKNGGITLKLLHRDSHLNPSTNHFTLLRSSFQRSFSRKEALQKTASNSKSLDSFESPVTPAGGEYLMKIKIGTPPVEILAIVDTGSDLTWTQCLPCKECYKQTSPYFDPTKTSTYRELSCSSGLCRSGWPGTYCTSNHCSYTVSYGDNSYSRGDLATDTFTFNSDNSKETLAIPKVAFGCGHHNGGLFNSSGSGIVGLGGGNFSIVQQLDKFIDGKFSYCLTYLNSNAPSKISFGTNAIVSGPNVVSTPLVKNSDSTFYTVTLEGISVGKKKFLHSSFDTSSMKSDDDESPSSSVEKGNFILDSGTTLTFLPQILYDLVESELVKSLKGKRVDDPQGTFGLCYDILSIEQTSVPQVVAHFTGADVTLAQGTVLVEVEKGIVCLTLVASQEFYIFGNLHQTNHHIGYDLVNQKVSFLPTDCSKLK